VASRRQFLIRQRFPNRARHSIRLGNLNTFSFLITLLHELAHLVTFEKYGNRVQAHGKEWKIIFGQFLQQFLIKNIFPSDIEKELIQSLKNPAASSCAEDALLRVLRKYNKTKTNQMMVEEISLNMLFRLKDGRVFQKGEKLRKRFKCIEVATGKIYLFSPVYEIELTVMS